MVRPTLPAAYPRRVVTTSISVVTDPTLTELLREARTIWGQQRMALPEVAIAAGVVCGDLCRCARDHQEGRHVSADDLMRELGNLILSAVRWSDDLGLIPADCVTSAISAQRAYVGSRAPTS